MIYRVILCIGYYENWFDFDNVSEAAKFAETVMEHQKVNNDIKERRVSVTIKVIDSSIKKEDED